MINAPGKYSVKIDAPGVTIVAGTEPVRARQIMATDADMDELIRLGAYRAGTNAEGRRGDQPAQAA
jgi:hypothetical protein